VSGAIVTRFAPSPTGRLHVGNIRTALMNRLLALPGPDRGQGHFLLRLDDTDAQRSTEAFADAIRRDLEWLGLEPDASFRQSERAALYEERFERLRAAGRVYPAYETPEELSLKRRVALGRGLPPVYDRAALRLSEAERARLEADGMRPHWRFRLDEEPIAWDDGIRGPQRFDPAALGDPVVRRADGSFLYLLPSAIDDAEAGVTDVVRGEDHVSNTAAQVQMFRAMGAQAPRFAHAALLTGAEGKLSKRLGSLGCDAFREAGIEPVALLSLLARLGTSDPPEPAEDLDALARGFDLSRFGRAPARFDEEELAALNARTVHALPHAAVADRLPGSMGADGWAAIRPNLRTVADAADWWTVVEGPVAPDPSAPEDRDYLAAAARAAGELDWSADPWGQLTGRLKAETGRKGRALFQPLRLVLTGRAHGPDMAALLPLIGRERAVARLGARPEA